MGRAWRRPQRAGLRFASAEIRRRAGGGGERLPARLDDLLGRHLHVLLHIPLSSYPREGRLQHLPQVPRCARSLSGGAFNYLVLAERWTVFAMLDLVAAALAVPV